MISVLGASLLPSPSLSCPAPQVVAAAQPSPATSTIPHSLRSSSQTEAERTLCQTAEPSAMVVCPSQPA
eukprot:4961157-Pyramimonas_sp.AAC.1